jgi:hypothetical protein
MLYINYNKNNIKNKNNSWNNNKNKRDLDGEEKSSLIN